MIFIKHKSKPIKKPRPIRRDTNRRERKCTQTVSCAESSGTSAKVINQSSTYAQNAHRTSGGMKRVLLSIIASLTLGLLMLMPMLAIIGKAWLGFTVLAVLCMAGFGVEKLLIMRKEGKSEDGM